MYFVYSFQHFLVLQLLLLVTMMQVVQVTWRVTSSCRQWRWPWEFVHSTVVKWRANASASLQCATTPPVSCNICSHVIQFLCHFHSRDYFSECRQLSIKCLIVTFRNKQRTIMNWHRGRGEHGCFERCVRLTLDDTCSWRSLLRRAWCKSHRK